MENTLHNDYSLKKHTLVADDPPDAYPPLKLQYLLEVHDRFMINFVEGTIGSMLENLWAVTSGLCSQKKDVHWLHNTVTRIRNSQEADTVSRLSNELAARINDVVERQADENDPTVKRVKQYCALLESEDKRYLHKIKMALRAGIQVFEKYERDTTRLGSAQLIEAVRQVPKILGNYHARTLSGILSILLARPE